MIKNEFVNQYGATLYLNYYECLAKIILETQFPDEYCVLHLRDKPDLHDPYYDIGVEVTCCILPKRQELVSNWSNASAGKGKTKEIYINKIKQFGVEYNDNIPFWRCLYEYRNGMEDNSIDLFYNAFDVKLKKLNKRNYAPFKRYDLFVHSDLIIKESPETIIEHLIVMNNNYILTYSTVYLLSLDKLYIFDLIHHGYMETEYTSAEQAQWAIVAEKIVNEGYEEEF